MSRLPGIKSFINNEAERSSESEEENVDDQPTQEDADFLDDDEIEEEFSHARLHQQVGM